jgi:DNA-directed RNA polymerase specialized sigma24 family protein
VTAETFRVAFENLARFEWRGVPFSAWLFRHRHQCRLDQARLASRAEELTETHAVQDESWKPV